jgi:fanconi-associated nuclease 1
LDLFTDGFYLARASEINHRLVEITNGDAARIIEEIDKAHRERKTQIIGLDWGFEKNDLLEIVKVRNLPSFRIDFQREYIN